MNCCVPTPTRKMRVGVEAAVAVGAVVAVGVGVGVKLGVGWVGVSCTVAVDRTSSHGVVGRVDRVLG